VEADWKNSPRDADKADVLIVGGGPAGLSAAIRIKQLCQKQDRDLRVCVLEKASEIGMHTLSGAVLEPRALKELISEEEYQSLQTSDGILGTPVTKDNIYFLYNGTSGKIPLPIISEQNNHGNFIISAGNLVKWLGAKAEEMGVEIYPGYPASEILYNEDGSVKGVATGDVGITKKGVPGPNFARGLELHAPVTLFGEGCRGSLSQLVMSKFNLTSSCDPQTYGIGIKEVWEVDPKNHKKGSVLHTIGWPITDLTTWGGSFMYHYGTNLVSLGYVVGLDYKNTNLRPYMELQRLKHHNIWKEVLEGGKCISYGARALNEGGIQSIPKLVFPGGALIGCSAGFLNVSKIKGIHTSMKSGMLAAEAAFNELTKEGYPDVESESRPSLTLNAYADNIANSWVYDELRKVRNIRPAYTKGLPFFMAFSGFHWLVSKGKEPWTWHHHKDHEQLKPAEKCKPINYPKPDGVLSFDLLTNLARSGTNHNDDQPAHLLLKDPKVQQESYAIFKGPESRYCPAQVYEWIDDGQNGKRLQINAQNCLHCKTCDIKDPKQNILWVVPEGGGGPAYSGM